jgi:hypothetical protein
MVFENWKISTSLKCFNMVLSSEERIPESSSVKAIAFLLSDIYPPFNGKIEVILTRRGLRRRLLICRLQVL